MDEDLTLVDNTNYDDILEKKIKGIEKKCEELKKDTCKDDVLKEINELIDQAIKLKENVSNIYFQYLKTSSIIIYEKKLKDLIKDIETLKQSSIKNKNEKAYTPNEFNYDDNFLLPDDDYLFKEKEEVQVNENMIDLSQYKMSFQNMENKRIIKGFGETGCSNLLLDNLVNCEIIILDILSSVLIQKIKQCTIWVSAVESSLMIYNCQDCNILSNSKQIRIHDAVNTNFYINTISNPIIENSTKLIFHKYNLIFDELSELLQKININKDSTKWMEIMDFNWQNTQEKSPNFCINTEVQIYNIKIKYIKKFNGLHQEKLTHDNYVIENFPPFLKRIN
ncbi:tubulin binding cofactor c, putative [Plasmodium reichenowi]|uniref:Tubulin binding cofactor c, putative n=1 Tax=Plasmodium reichenowi TaxID=5854 RepID=A0A060RTI5_PLARE|nr:tubulin binding cofactor c, putative [Plasmodium reichenowi]KYN97608.1 tubulin binding cofactor c, putative [Plasmodium reichenowi]CDO64588.1 tubulin binding cofactor c, putative [Plasmodium reichenowi]SOV79746.1 tubulin binding cofactor c, putative [Plasmodium reichenowi]